VSPMATIQLPISSIRIPRIEKGDAGWATRELYTLFGYASCLLASQSGGEIYTIVVPSDWDNDQIVNEFDRLMAVGADTDPVGLPVLGLNPMEFVRAGDDHFTQEEAVYKALGIDYRIVSAENAGRLVVLRDYVRYVASHVAKCSAQTVTIGQPEPSTAPVGIRATRVDKALEAPKMVEFATTYEKGNAPLLLALAKLCGLNYVREMFEYCTADGKRAATDYGVSSTKYAHFLDGFGNTAAERTQQYLLGPLTKECAKRGNPNAQFYLYREKKIEPVAEKKPEPTSETEQKEGTKYFLFRGPEKKTDAVPEKKVDAAPKDGTTYLVHAAPEKKTELAPKEGTTYSEQVSEDEAFFEKVVAKNSVQREAAISAAAEKYVPEDGPGKGRTCQCGYCK
jgi:hypothetical protein